MYRYASEIERIQKLIGISKEEPQGSPHFSEVLRREGIPHLSFTQVSTVESCEHRYYLQYVQGIELDPVPEYFTKGKLLHEAIAGVYEHLRDEEDFEPEVFHTYLRDHYRGASLHHLDNALEVALENLWEGMIIREVEHPFVMTLDEDLPPFVGVIDLVLQNEESVFLVDHKTGRNFYEPDAMQMALYGEYARRQYNPGHVHAFYDQYRWVENLARIRKPAFQRFEVSVTPRSVQSGLGRVRAAWARIERIHNSGPSSVSGRCFACPYRGMCSYF